MDVRSKNFHKTWLLVTAVIVGAFGPVFSLATQGISEEMARWTLDFLAWPLDGTQQYSDGAMRFLSALTGGFLLGWGVMIFCLRQWVYDIAPEQTRRAVLCGLLAWFVLDSTGSVSAGVPSNVVFNVIVLFSAVGPLWWSARSA